MSKVPGIALGIYEKALPLSLSWPQRLEMAAQAGFDFVEMSIDPTEHRLSRLNWSPAERHEMRQIIEEAPIPILTICLSAHRQYPLGSPSKKIRDEGLKIIHETIRIASDLGIRMIQVAGYDTQEGPSNANSQLNYLEGLREAVNWASERAVLMGLENQEDGYIDSPTKAVEIIRQLSSPYLGLYMDIGNLIVNQCDVLREIVAARGYLTGLHIKDALPRVPRRVPFGKGSVPFEAIFRQLALIGFRGPVVIEMWNDDHPDSLAICTEAQRWVKQRLERAYLPEFEPLGLSQTDEGVTA